MQIYPLPSNIVKLQTTVSPNSCLSLSPSSLISSRSTGMGRVEPSLAENPGVTNSHICFPVPGLPIPIPERREASNAALAWLHVRPPQAGERNAPVQGAGVVGGERCRLGARSMAGVLCAETRIYCLGCLEVMYTVICVTDAYRGGFRMYPERYVHGIDHRGCRGISPGVVGGGVVGGGVVVVVG